MKTAGLIYSYYHNDLQIFQIKHSKTLFFKMKEGFTFAEKPDKY